MGGDYHRRPTYRSAEENGMFLVFHDDSLPEQRRFEIKLQTYYR